MIISAESRDSLYVSYMAIAVVIYYMSVSDCNLSYYSCRKGSILRSRSFELRVLPECCTASTQAPISA
jgi:hypothetical protein